GAKVNTGHGICGCAGSGAGAAGGGAGAGAAAVAGAGCGAACLVTVRCWTGPCAGAATTVAVDAEGAAGAAGAGAAGLSTATSSGATAIGVAMPGEPAGAVSASTPCEVITNAVTAAAASVAAPANTTPGRRYQGHGAGSVTASSG